MAITDIAIQKVSRVEYHGLTEDQNDFLYRIAREVLLRAMVENDSNEVAITIDLDNLDDEIGVAYGNEHSVDVGSDSTSFHILLSGENVATVHNHPSTQTLSLTDVEFLLRYERLKYMVVVTNQGVVHYLMKTEEFDFKAALALAKECTDELTEKSSVIEHYRAGLEFLAHCSEAGLSYH